MNWKEDKYAWLDSWRTRDDLNSSQKAVLFALFARFNGKGEAWPSQATIAKDTGLGERTVRRALAGVGQWVSIETGAGRTSSVYRPVMVTTQPGQTDRSPRPDRPVSPVTVATQPGHSGRQIVHRSTQGRNQGSTPPTPPGGSESESHSKTPKKKPDLPPELLADFTAFWQLYPRKVGKPSARRAYAKARKAGATAGEILSGLRELQRDFERRKAKEGPAEAIQFTPHASTWLNDERWTAGEEAPPPPENEWDRQMAVFKAWADSIEGKPHYLHGERPPDPRKTLGPREEWLAAQGERS